MALAEGRKKRWCKICTIQIFAEAGPRKDFRRDVHGDSVIENDYVRTPDYIALQVLALYYEVRISEKYYYPLGMAHFVFEKAYNRQICSVANVKARNFGLHAHNECSVEEELQY